MLTKLTRSCSETWRDRVLGCPGWRPQALRLLFLASGDLKITWAVTLALLGEATLVALPSEAYTTGKVIFKSPVVKSRSLKVRGLQPEQPNTRSPQVSEQDRVRLVTIDLQEFLTNKQKLELLHTSSSCCEQVGCQLVIVYSVYCWLGLVPPLLQPDVSFRSTTDSSPCQASQKRENHETCQIYLLHPSTW